MHKPTKIITSLPTVHVCTEPSKLEVKTVPLFVQARPLIGILCKLCIILCCGFWIKMPSFTEIENITTDDPLHMTRWWSSSWACKLKKKTKQKYDSHVMQINSKFTGFWSTYLELLLSNCTQLRVNFWSIPNPCIHEHLHTLHVKDVKWTVPYTCILYVVIYLVHKFYTQTHLMCEQSF